MSAAIGPGDWVENFRGECPPPMMNGVPYLAVEVWFDPDTWDVCANCPDDGVDYACVVLAGVNTREQPLCACSLRPVYRPKADLIESLKQPSPELEPA